MLTRRHRPDRGFSLIELLVTIVVLGVLATVVTFAVRGVSSSARASSCAADSEILDRAQGAYMAQHGRYATEGELVAERSIRGLSLLSDITLSGDDYEVVAVGECVGAQQVAASSGGGGPGTTVAGPAPTTSTVVLAGPTTTVPTAVALTISAVPSSVTAGAVITPAPTVTVLDANGDTFAGTGMTVTIALSTNPGGATLSGTKSVIAVDGIATFGDLSLDKSGSGYQFIASASGTTTSTSTAVVVQAAAAASMVITEQPTGGLTSSAWTTQPVVELRDAFGNIAPTSTAPVTLSIAAGTGTPGATLTCSSNPTNASAGVAGFSGCRIGTAGTGYRLTAASPGLASQTTGPINVSGPPTRVVITTQPTNETVGDALSPSVVVAVQDASGNVVTGSTATVTLAISTNPGSGTLSGSASVAAVNGIATFPNLSINKPGTGYRLTASSAGLTPIASNTFNILLGAPAQLTVITQPAGIRAGVVWTTQPRVAIQDAAGNTITTSTANVTLSIVPGSGTPGAILICTANPRSAVSGIATFAGCKIDKPGDDYEVTARSPNLPDETITIDNPVGPATKVVITQQPTNSMAGSALAPSVIVAVQDAVGNVVTGSTATVSLAISTNPGSGTLSGSASVAAVNGIATFPGLSINRTGVGYRLTASSTGLTLIASNTFNITIGPAAQLAFTTQPNGGAVNATWTAQPRVTVRDALGNTVTTSTAVVTLTITPGTGVSGAKLTCTTNPRTAVAGLATFAGCRINNSGTGYTLTAASPGLTTAVSQAFAIS